MTPRQAALHYAASLIEQQLAAAHKGSRGDRIRREDGSFDDDFSKDEVREVYAGKRLTLDTFEKAPPNVAQALSKGLDGEAVAEEMAKLAEELRRPEKLSLTDEMFRTAARRAIAFEAEHGAAPSIGAAREQDVEIQVQRILSNAFEVSIDALHPLARFVEDLHGDSLVFVEAILDLEEHFGIEIDDDASIGLKTVQDVVDYVRSHRR